MAADRLAEKEATPAQMASVVAEDDLRVRARKHVERVHGVKENVALFLVGMFVLTPIWLIVEWQSAGSFERWSDGGNPGDWDPWILWIAVPWFLWVAFVVLHAYFDRNKEEEIEREVRRLRASG